MIKLFGFTILSEQDRNNLVRLPEHYTYNSDHWRGFERYRNDLREKLGYLRLSNYNSDAERQLLEMGFTKERINFIQKRISVVNVLQDMNFNVKPPV